MTGNKRRVPYDWLLAVLFLTGIGMTASDGHWFPLLNLVGISLIALSSYLTATRIDNRLH